MDGGRVAPPPNSAARTSSGNSHTRNPSLVSFASKRTSLAPLAAKPRGWLPDACTQSSPPSSPAHSPGMEPIAMATIILPNLYLLSGSDMYSNGGRGRWAEEQGAFPPSQQPLRAASPIPRRLLRLKKKYHPVPQLSIPGRCPTRSSSLLWMVGEPLTPLPLCLYSRREYRYSTDACRSGFFGFLFHNFFDKFSRIFFCLNFTDVPNVECYKCSGHCCAVLSGSSVCPSNCLVAIPNPEKYYPMLWPGSAPTNPPTVHTSNIPPAGWGRGRGPGQQPAGSQPSPSFFGPGSPPPHQPRRPTRAPQRGRCGGEPNHYVRSADYFLRVDPKHRSPHHRSPARALIQLSQEVLTDAPPSLPQDALARRYRLFGCRRLVEVPPPNKRLKAIEGTSFPNHGGGNFNGQEDRLGLRFVLQGSVGAYLDLIVRP